MICLRIPISVAKPNMTRKDGSSPTLEFPMRSSFRLDGYCGADDAMRAIKPDGEQTEAFRLVGLAETDTRK